MIRLATEGDRYRLPSLHRRLEAALVAQNRQLVAERLPYPPGSLEICERIEVEHPGWDVFWHPANEIVGWEHPAGYVARCESSGYVCGADRDALEAAMAAAPAERHSHWHKACCDRIPVD